MQQLTSNNGAYLFRKIEFVPKCVVKQGQNPVSQIKQAQWKCLKSLAPPLMAVGLAFSPICITPVSHAQTVDVQRGASLFRTSCIGCHDAGGNIIQPGATLFTKDLERNGVDTEEEIYRVTLAREECQVLVRTAHRGANAHLELVCRMRTLSFWLSLSSYRRIKTGRIA